MGNQQTLNSSYYNFVENDSDSGYGDLSSSPFELNKNTSFNYLYETDHNTSSFTTPVPSPQAILNVVSSRKNSLVKSKSIDINCIDTNNNSSSIHSSNLISSSWSPNSNNFIKQTNQNKEERIQSIAIPIVKELKQEKSASTYPLSFLSGMNFVGRVARGVKDFYNEINPATLTGAIDVVVVQQQDGSFRCSPFHVRFGKLGVIRSKEKIVDIEINGQKVDDLHMVLGEAGEAFFVEKVTIDLDNNEYITACDLASVTVQELSALIAASTAVSSTITKSTDSLIETTKVVSLVKQSQSSFDLVSPKLLLNDSTDKTLVKSRDTTPQKTQPIPISSPKLNSAASSTPLTINTDTSPVASSPSIIIASPDIEMSSKGNDLNKQNFFSDGELTPELTSPAVSRPPTPKSDTELEVYKIKRSNTTNDVLNQWNWHWGELPSRQNNKNSKLVDQSELVTKQLSNDSTSDQANAKSPSKILGMFNLISKTNENKDGIYLDETEKLDSEVAALYLDQKSNSHQKSKQIANLVISTSKDDDQESGNGQSLPQSPLRDYYSVIGDVQLSLCGFVLNNQTLNAVQDSQQQQSQQQLVVLPPNEIDPANLTNFEELFQQNAVSYEKFSDEFNTITMNPNLIVKINNKYMNWQAAAPIILSAVVFNKNLTNEINDKKPVQQIIQQSNDKKESWVKMFGWGKSKTSTPEIAAPATLTTISAIQKQTTTTTTTTTVTTTVQTNLLGQQDTNELEMVFNEDLPLESIGEPTDLVKTESPDSSNEERKPEVRYRKTTRLSSDLINKLNLQPGSNEIQYSVTTALQGTTRITSYIFLWYYDDKVIVSDIDGTITKSDVWGQVLPIFGRDWSQAGVADLFTAIERNQYKFMYLSARAIGQSKITRDLLRNINQGGYTLPEGPLLVTPTSLFTAFQKEVIEKKPEEFKISCLKDIQSLFPSHNPYYAGYGNKSSDVKSYRTVCIPESRIFTINPQGEVKHEVSGAFQSSYSKLCDYVDLIFPPFKAPLEIKAEYDSFNYWRDLTPLTINDEIEREIIESLKEAKDANNNSKDSKANKQQKSLKGQQSTPLAITTSASKLALSNSATTETN